MIMTINIQNENMTFIALKDLFLSEHNVRTVPATKEQDKLLRASIKAQGITQNLIVVPKDKLYGVIAGGRRLTQLSILLEEGFINNGYLVPCLIESEENISAISLAENIKCTMHPADEFMAFQSMIDEGKTIADISNEFGITQTLVKKRLKMAGVAPELIKHYRNGKIDLDAIMAFTVSDDHDKQIACYKELSAHYMGAWHIKRYLLDAAISTEDGLVKLVTLKAFKKAGGSVTTDLFESESYINERELLESLALDILNKKAAPLKKQWKWVDVSITGQGNTTYKDRLQADLINVPETLTADITEKQTALDALYAQDDWSEDDEALSEELSAAIEALENKQEKYRQFTDEQKAVSGALVSVSREGEIAIDVGLVKKEDMALAFPKSDTDLELVNGAHSVNGIESGALKADLQNFKLQALQSEIMKDDKLTYDLMVFTLAKSVLHQNGYYSKALDVDVSIANLSATQGIDETTAHDAMTAFKDSLEVSWLSHISEAEKFNAFRALTSIQKKRLLSYCTAQSYQANTELAESVEDAVSFDITQHWTPTKDNYFKRIKANDLIVIGTEKIGQEWASMNAKLPKAKLVEHLASHKDMAHWMPVSMV